jgi:hypothetical protein
MRLCMDRTVDRRSTKLLKRRPLVHRDMIGPVAFDLILRFFLTGMNRITFERDRGGYDFGDPAAYTPGFRVPTHVIASLETFPRHLIPLNGSVIRS